MMRRLACLSVAILIAQALCPSRGGLANGQERTSAKRVGSLHVEEFGAYNALGEISQKAHVVIGVDAVQPKGESTIVLDFPGGTVAGLLDMFVSQSPDYRWEETNTGILHVSRDNAHVSLLDVQMSYPGAFKKTRREIWEDIAKRPEVEAWMQSNRCVREEFFNGKEFREHNDPISIAPGSLTVAQLLDEVAVKSRVDYWAVLQSPPGTSCRMDIILW
jgi:hypothetical protein